MDEVKRFMDKFIKWFGLVTKKYWIMERAYQWIWWIRQYFWWIKEETGSKLNKDQFDTGWITHFN